MAKPTFVSLKKKSSDPINGFTFYNLVTVEATEPQPDVQIRYLFHGNWIKTAIERAGEVGPIGSWVEWKMRMGKYKQFHGGDFSEYECGSPKGRLIQHNPLRLDTSRTTWWKRKKEKETESKSGWMNDNPMKCRPFKNDYFLYRTRFPKIYTCQTAFHIHLAYRYFRFIHFWRWTVWVSNKIISVLYWRKTEYWATLKIAEHEK